ncbi:hypothetical protein ACIQM0_23775 [Streptomyces sp. NPDC091387]|uniref:hypothetical protein n=1 Tax=Streptomyces sp. NPDC091387 TaxID=3365998 RepID=UPI00380944A7
MQYEEPRRLSMDDAAEIFENGNPYDIAESLISASLYLPDRGWVEQWVIHFTSHSSPDVRRASALALGHLARLHGAVSPQAVAAVSSLRADVGLHGAANDALEDVEIFTRGN